MRLPLAALLLLVAGAVAPNEAWSQAQLRVFACVPEWASLSQELGGDKVTTSLGAGPLQDPDEIEVKPVLLRAVREANLVVCTGPLEASWLPNLLRRAGNVNVRPGTPGYFAAADYVKMMAVPKQPGQKLDAHSSGHPHIQTDPRNIRAVAVQLGRRLAEIDPPNAAVYNQRTRAFVDKLDQAVKRWEEQAAPLKGINVIAQHDDLNYLLVWLGVNQVANVELTPGQAPPPAHLAKIIDLIPAQKVRFLINGAFEDPKSMTYVAERAKVPLATLSFTVGGNSAATDLFTLFDDMIGRMLQAAQGAGRS
ncbi:MAG: zinc ABC transporter substrate-binding protein [Proteobacteria bacterium]|nr:zinc ABC transporter substrate-binding protein [Pseudomonadota bacterium]